MSTRASHRLGLPLVSALLLALLCLSGFRVSHPAPPALAQPQDHVLTDVASLVVVTEDRARVIPGCDAVSVFDLENPSEPLLSGETHVSPGRLAGLSDLSIVLASNSNYAGMDSSCRRPGLCERRRFLYGVWRSGIEDSEEVWSAGSVIRGSPPYFVLNGGIAMHGGRDSLYVSQAARGKGLAEVGPCSVARYRLPKREAASLGIALAAAEVEGPAVEILLPRSGAVIHVVTAKGVLHTLDATSLKEVSQPITMPRLVVNGREIPTARTNFVHATLSPDERFVVMNRWDVGEVSVADLLKRTADVRQLEGLKKAGGVAFNRGWIGKGRLAVHGIDRIGIYEWPADGAPRLVAMGEVPRLYVESMGDREMAGPQASIAWETSGARVIAAVADAAAEFWVLEAAGVGKLRKAFSLTACPLRKNLPNDILTANGFVSPSPTPQDTATPSPTTTASSTPTEEWTPSATSTATPTATFTSTATPTPTSTPTPLPRPLLLPLLLREHCQREHKRADVALVLDTSSSMAGTKLADAKAAAELFVGLMDLAPGRDQVTVVRFDRQAEVVTGLTTSRTVIQDAIRRLQVRRGTHIDAGLWAALGELQSPRHLPRNLPVAVLLTDGLHTGTPGEDLRAATALRGAGVRLYTIGLGADADEQALRAMAGEASRYFYAPDSSDLARIYSEIAQDLVCPGVELWGQR